VISHINKMIVIWRIIKKMDNELNIYANMLTMIVGSHKYNSNTLAKEICRRIGDNCNINTVRSQISRWKSGEKQISAKFSKIIENIYCECLDEIFENSNFVEVDKVISLLK
jgi:hypothetical protein